MIVTIKETRATWVDYFVQVVIDDDTGPDDILEAAQDAQENGEYEYVGCAVGDSLEFVDSESEIVDCVPFNASV